MICPQMKRPLVASGFLLLTVVSIAVAGDDLVALQADFLRGEYASVVSRTRQLLDGGDSKESDTLLYLQGISALKLRSLESAQSALKRLLAEYPQSRWAIQGGVALGEAFLAAGQSQEAQEVYQKLLKDSRAAPFYPLVGLRLGQVQLRLGRWEEARASLEGVVSQVPGSPEAVQAKELLGAEAFYFSVQVGAFGSRANALKVKSECDRRGYQAEVSQALMQGRRFHRVRVGRFAQREEAEKEAQRLKADGFSTRVVP